MARRILSQSQMISVGISIVLLLAMINVLYLMVGSSHQQYSIPVYSIKHNFTSCQFIITSQSGNPSLCDRRVALCQRRFVLALEYWEQLTMATNNFFDLVAYAKEWTAHAVVPFTRYAQLWGFPFTASIPVTTGWFSYIFHGSLKLHSGLKGLPLSKLYNMTKINDLLCHSYNLPSLITFQDFLDNADRNIIFVHFNFDTRFPKKKDFGEDRHFLDCTNTRVFRRLLKTINKECTKRNRPPFVMKKACCIDHRHAATPVEVANNCGIKLNDSFTVVPTVWHGSTKDPKRNFRLVVSKDVPMSHPDTHKDIVPVSDGILSNSSAFFKSFSNGNDIISVHIRTAKLGMLGKRDMALKCFMKTWNLVSLLQVKYPHMTVKYFVDYGKFGSHAGNTISVGRTISKKPFKERKIYPIHYNPDDHNGIRDQGFVALVEQVAISNASVLVLVGGGSFQEQIFTRFRSNGHTLSAYQVCWTESLLVKQVYSEGHYTNLIHV